jgi:hypothetical protein
MWPNLLPSKQIDKKLGCKPYGIVIIVTTNGDFGTKYIIFKLLKI